MRSRNERVSLLIRERLPSAHHKGVNCLEVYNDSLITGGRDGLIHRWDLTQSLPSLLNTFDGHVHWVNALQIDNTQNLLFSGSSDTNILIWKLPEEDSKQIVAPFHVINNHKDYLQALKYNQREGILYSGGQDGHLMRWDLNRLDQINSGRVLQTQGQSIWSIDCDESGNLILASFCNKIPKVIDIREPQKCSIYELKGHSDHVRVVKISPDGRQCITGSSDKTVKLWALPENRCIDTLSIHTDSVYALDVNWGTGICTTGGRDRMIHKWNFIMDSYEKFAEESQHVLNIKWYEDELWIGTIDSSIRSYKNTGVNRQIDGLPSINKYTIPDNKRYVITKDTSGKAQAWDVLKCREVESDSNFDSLVQKYSSGKAKSSWFSANIRLGRLMVDFSHIDAHLAEDITEEGKINYGVKLLRKAFHYYLKNRQENEIGIPLDSTQVSKLIEAESGIEDVLVIIFQGNSDSGDLVMRNYVDELGQPGKLEELPVWVKNLVYGIKSPTSPKIHNNLVYFNLEPMDHQEIPELKAPRLNAPEMVRVKRVVEYVLDNLKGNAKDFLQPDIPPEDNLDIICCNYILNKEATLGFIREVLYESKDELKLFYRIKPELKK